MDCLLFLVSRDPVMLRADFMVRRILSVDYLDAEEKLVRLPVPCTTKGGDD